MATELVIGAPVKDRAWILQYYLSAAIKAVDLSGFDAKFIFAVDTRSHDDVDEIVGALTDTKYSWEFVPVRDIDLKYKRDWNNKHRYDEMVYVRNELLNAVRREAPDFFLSLDSDMIIHPQLINNLMENVHKFDAIGGKAYMTPSRTSCPSFGIFNRSNVMQRKDGEGVFPVDVIMAIKFMTPVAYEIDYKYHHLGEDIGWSNQAREAGLSLGWDGRMPNKHVMNIDMLKVDDSRVPWCKWTGNDYELV